MQKRTLVGHSGCKLEIQERGAKLVVVKTAKDAAYNSRLIKQCEKQAKFKHDAFRTPAIIETNYDQNGLFRFAMEYANGMTLAEHLHRAEISSLPAIAETFLTIVPASFDYDKNAKKVFEEKIAELEKKLGGTDDATQKALRRLKEYNWQYCAASDCHGDMTLENIIWSDGELHLVDFLDSFYDSWMMDISKLLFDLECLWSYRHLEHINENLAIRVLILKNAILDKLSSLPDGPHIRNTIDHIALLHLLRIIPYAEDDHTKKHLQKSLQRMYTVLKTV